ncbi:MAG: phosphate:Na+ symporter [Flavobacteriales bacterium]|jgi:phosphate:Na+ symporter|tara:strand:- start:4166 stop:5866 length:1701 start_codon:yes stop_codon:yes gene_type:complete
MEFGIYDVFKILGALAFFIYGMKMMSDGIQKAAGGSLKNILGTMTQNRFVGVVSGFLVTALVQSSSATTVMTVSFVNAGIIDLTQSAGVLLGANVGTTITAWLVTLLGFKVKISVLSLPLLAIAVPMLFAKKRKVKFYGEFIVGFAILFWGLDVLKHAVPDLKGNADALYFLQSYADGGFLSNVLFIGVGTLLTIIVQSSSAAMALTITLSMNGIIPFEVAAAMVLGENIGTTITAWLASIPANVHAKRAARIHSLFNIIGVVWMLILISWVIDLPVIIQWINTNILQSTLDITTPDGRGHGISIFHTSFNILNVLIMVWFVPWLVNTATKMVKSKGDIDEEFHLEHIGGGLLPSSELSLMEAKKEAQKFTDVASRMNGFVKTLVNETDKKAFDKMLKKVRKYEDITDRIEEEMAIYLTKIGQGSLTEDTSTKIRALHKMIANLERIGDIYYGMSISLENKKESKVWFTQGQRDNLNKYLDLLDKTFNQLKSNLESEFGQVNLDKAIELEHDNNKLQESLHQQHIIDLEKGEYDFKSAMHYRDLFMACEKVGDHLINVSESMQMKI